MAHKSSVLWRDFTEKCKGCKKELKIFAQKGSESMTIYVECGSCGSVAEFCLPAN